ncbi:secondary thiamine-phosphate synthase enzyme YjbQ [Synechococcus sp. UW179A]|uniref:secondary thiamine-phosphate synthase enzyme YjbQ n=1 Tax=Synechococcus sp. UW179A TaxID=2575510 RepID=UPI000E0FC868|nr:secondary thiamine-phosphate synthase enzyme YjbQ [Synechococcus sp. UW179A]
MTIAQRLHELEISTDGAGFSRLNEPLNHWIARTDITQGVLHLTCLHTSCSLTINENADPRVLKDLAAWMNAMVPQDGAGPTGPDGKRRRYLHDDEGDDDMPAHIRTALTTQTMSLSVDNGRLLLGTWQAVYLWEHRSSPHHRRLACHLIGDMADPPSDQSQLLASGKNTTAKLLARRNGQRLNDVVQARHVPGAWAEDGGIETDVDLLIDRLHEISDQQ